MSKEDSFTRDEQVVSWDFDSEVIYPLAVYSAPFLSGFQIPLCGRKMVTGNTLEITRFDNRLLALMR